jgi:hypothetical protein
VQKEAEPRLATDKPDGLLRDAQRDAGANFTRAQDRAVLRKASIIPFQ